MNAAFRAVLLASVLLPASVAAADPPPAMLRGEILDAETGQRIAARIYLRSSGGTWHFVRSAAVEGSAIEYRKQRFEQCVEMHTTISAHEFQVELPPGEYTISVERGKEYLPYERTIDVGQQPEKLRIELRRWIKMAERGWYSGDTHVHRSLEELPNLLLAEDLNVALPLSYWVTQAYAAPAKGDKTTESALPAQPIAVDATHVIYPINTEYEIFTVNGKRHTLGAVFILGHQKPFARGAPPVGPIAAQARREGGLLELDKHSWPWSLMLVPVMKVDLFELSNNHVWRTRFGFSQWTLDTAPSYMRLERDQNGFTEWGWIDYGFQTYYALLNCGFRLRPTAGTASGVHPVPLGFGRVYVHLPDGFAYQSWMRGLASGQSFVTTGPMLDVSTNGSPMGATLSWREPGIAEVRAIAHSAAPLRSMEFVVNGKVVKALTPDNRKRTDTGGFVNERLVSLPIAGSSWIAVRIFEKHPEHRVRFAHSSPAHIEIPGRPLRPRREESDFLAQRMQEELARNRDVLPDAELQEYRQALEIYRSRAKSANP